MPPAAPGSAGVAGADGPACRIDDGQREQYGDDAFEDTLPGVRRQVVGADARREPDDHGEHRRARTDWTARDHDEDERAEGRAHSGPGEQHAREDLLAAVQRRADRTESESQHDDARAREQAAAVPAD